MDTPGKRTLQVGHGVFDPLTGDLSLGGRTVRLRPRTAALLAYLVQHGDRVIPKDELMQTLWPDVVVTEDSIVQCVKEIRQALGEGGRAWIRTLPRTGYAFVGNRDAPPPGRSWRRLGHPWQWLAVFVVAISFVGSLAWWLRSPARETSSMLVLPFANATGDAAYDRSADDLTEAITDKFGRARGRIRVVAPSTARAVNVSPVDVRALGTQLKVQYVLQGALLLDEHRPVLRLRLADAANSIQLWQQDFKINAGLPEMRPEFVSGIMGSLVEQLVRAEAARSGNPDAIKAAELLSRANDVLRGAGSEADKNARFIALLEAAVRLDDNLAEAWAPLAAGYLGDVRFSAARAQRLQRAGQAIERARKLIPADDGIIAWEASVYWEQGRVAEALKASERALELNPGNVRAMYMRARSLIMLAQPREALAELDKARRTSPRDPLIPGIDLVAGSAYLQLGDDAAALDALQAAAKMIPNEPYAQLLLAAALADADRIEEARAAMARFQQLRPGVTLTWFRATEPSQLPAFLQQRQRLYEGLRRAGMPE